MRRRSPRRRECSLRVEAGQDAAKRPGGSCRPICLGQRSGSNEAEILTAAAEDLSSLKATSDARWGAGAWPQLRGDLRDNGWTYMKVTACVSEGRAALKRRPRMSPGQRSHWLESGARSDRIRCRRQFRWHAGGVELPTRSRRLPAWRGAASTWRCESRRSAARWLDPPGASHLWPLWWQSCL